MSDMTDTLYIIGNGFDLHHGLKTAYSDFRDSFASKNNKLWNMLNDVYGDVINQDLWWSDFEGMLGQIDYLNLIGTRNGEALGFMKVRNLLNGTLPPLFGKWIKDMNCLVPIDTSLCIDPNSLFFSFNYTLLLENSYLIKDDNIWHIHNSIRNADRIVVGHDSDERKLFADYLKYKEGKEPFRYDVAEQIRNEAVKGAKCVANRVYRHKETFLELYSNIKLYVAMGFSFNEIDMPYIKEILSVNENPSQANWKIYFHSKGEDEEIIDKLLKIGVKRDSITDLVKW